MKPLRDRDTADHAFRFKTFAFSLFGFVLGALCGVLISVRTGRDAIPLVPLAAVAVWAMAYFIPRWISERAGSAAAGIYFSSGSSTPMQPQYSRAEALIVREQYADAVAELEGGAAANANDRTPCLMLARLYRDRLDQPEEAARWFRAALSRPAADRHATPGIMRELIELYINRIGAPARALPDLARLAHQFPGTPAAEWARREMIEIKASMQDPPYQ